MKNNRTSTVTTPITRGRGRPVKADSDKQVIPVKVLVTPGQAEKLMKAAAARGLSVSTFIRLKLKI